MRSGHQPHHRRWVGGHVYRSQSTRSVDGCEVRVGCGRGVSGYDERCVAVWGRRWYGVDRGIILWVRVLSVIGVDVMCAMSVGSVCVGRRDGMQCVWCGEVLCCGRVEHVLIMPRRCANDCFFLS